MARAKADILGIALSGVCLVHCLALPVALLAAPAWHEWLGRTETPLHWLLFVLALVVTGWALYAGFRRHADARVPLTGAAGLAIMLLAAVHLFGRSAEASLTVLGAAVVAWAHVQNVRRCSHSSAPVAVDS